MTTIHRLPCIARLGTRPRKSISAATLKVGKGRSELPRDIENFVKEALVQLSIHRPSNIYMTAKQLEKAKAHVKKKSGIKDDFDLSFSGIDIKVI